MRSTAASPTPTGLTPADDAPSRVVAAARRRFFTHGFRKVTMDELAEELGMSKKTLYAHFDGKAALLEAVIRAKFRDVETGLAAMAAHGAEDFSDRLRRMLECLQGHLSEPQPPFVRDMRREPELFQLIQSLRREHIQRHFGRLIAEGRRAGLIRRDIPTAVIIEIQLAAIEAIINPQRLRELRLTPRLAFSQIVMVVLQGVLTGQSRMPRSSAVRGRRQP